MVATAVTPAAPSRWEPREVTIRLRETRHRSSTHQLNELAPIAKDDKGPDRNPAKPNTARGASFSVSDRFTALTCFFENCFRSLRLSSFYASETIPITRFSHNCSGRDPSPKGGKIRAREVLYCLFIFLSSRGRYPPGSRVFESLHRQKPSPKDLNTIIYHQRERLLSSQIQARGNIFKFSYMFKPVHWQKFLLRLTAVSLGDW